MKRSLRTAEERNSTEMNDFFYYDSKKFKMDKKFGRPLSNLRFMRSDEHKNQNVQEKKTNQGRVAKIRQQNQTMVRARKEIDGNEDLPLERPQKLQMDASTMTLDHQFGPDFVSKMFEENNNFLIEKFETLINTKLVEVESKTCVSVAKALEEQQDSLINKIGTLIESKSNKNLHKAESMAAAFGDSTAIALEHDAIAIDHETASRPVEEVTDSPNQSCSSAETEQSLSSGETKQHCDSGEPMPGFPFEEICEAEDLNLKLHESTCYDKMVTYVSSIGGTGPKATLKMFNKIFSKDLQGKFNWEGKGTTIQSFPKILALIHSAGRKVYGTYDESVTNEMIKNSLRNARAKKKH